MRTPGTRNGEPLAHFQLHLHDGGDACYEWPYYKVSGYGYIWVPGRRNVKVAALALEQTSGPRPPGLQVCHECRNPTCWNPAHLSWGTPAKNMADRDRHGMTRRGEQHGRAKLTWAIVEEARSRYAAGGVSQQALADEYGIAQPVLSRALRGVTWAIKA